MSLLRAAWALLAALPTLLSPLYLHGKGVLVVDVTPDATIGGGAGGLSARDVVYAINDCKVSHCNLHCTCALTLLGARRYTTINRGSRACRRRLRRRAAIAYRAT